MADKTVAIIGARLGSSRLPGKQLLPLLGKPLLTHTVNRLRSIGAIDEVILATTDSEQNLRLVDWAKSENVVPFAWNGDENDLMGRVDAAFQDSGADRFVYVCGDCALIHPSTIEKLIRASIDAGEDGFAGLAPLPQSQSYIHEGFDVYNKGFWSRMMRAAALPFEREHVGAVYHHQKKVKPTALVHVEDDPIFSSVQHRLSVDTRRDYLFMRKLYEDWYADNPADSLVDLRWVAKRLSREPELVAINAHVHQKRADEVPPKAIILCEASPEMGLGHLSRACVMAAALQDNMGAAVKIFIRGRPVYFSELDLLPHEWVDEFSHAHVQSDVLIVDLKDVDTHSRSIIERSSPDTKKIVIDTVRDHGDLFDMTWMPSAYVDPVSKKRLGAKLNYGFDCYLLRDTHFAVTRKETVRRIIVLTGGSDAAKLANTMPLQLCQTLPDNVQIDWVQGPYSDTSLDITSIDNRFNILRNPDDLPGILRGYDAALCVYGVSFYECLKAGLPVVAFDPLDAALPAEWGMLARVLPDFMCIDADHAIEQLQTVLGGSYEVPSDIQSALQNGTVNFAQAVFSLIYPATQRVAHDRA